MADVFDYYYVWLGIPPKEQPPNRYRLLGIQLFEENSDVIDGAADRQMAHLRTFQSGPHGKLTQRLLNEVSTARVSLLNPKSKAEYDQQLRAGLPAATQPAADSAIRGSSSAQSGSRIGKTAPANAQVARPLPTATSIAPSTPQSNWDALMGSSADNLRPTGGKPVQLGTARTKSVGGLKFLVIGIAAVLVAAIGVGAWMMSSPAEAVLTFDWPAADRTSAALAIDDQPVAIPVSGPWEFRCPPGQHRIIAQRSAFKLEKTVTLAAGEQQTVAAEWKPKAVLVLKWPAADRAGAELVIDGRTQPASQREPLEFPVEPGRHVVRVTKANSEQFESAEPVAANEHRSVTVALIPWPTLVLNLPVDQRKDAAVTIDNRTMEIDFTAETLDFQLKPGQHTVHIARPGFQPFEQVATLGVGATPVSPTWQPAAKAPDLANDKTILANGLTPGTKAYTPTPSAAPPPDKKLPVPSVAAQAESLKSVKETFNDDYAKKTPADEVALAKKLFDAAVDTKDSAADRFTLLAESRDLATRGGSLELSMQAIDKLADEFAVNSIPMKTKALTELAKTFTPPDGNNSALIEAFLSLVNEAIGADDYAVAGQLLIISKPAGRKSNDKRLVAQLDHLGKDLPLIQKHHEEIKPALETLKQKPDDPEANLTAGKLLCFWKGRWDEGLPMLAKGNDAKLKEIVARELDQPQGSTEQVELGDAWWALAETEPEPVKRHIKQRAANWYDRAFPELNGLTKGKVEIRLKETDYVSAAAKGDSSPRKVDLFKLVDVNRDATGGVWKFAKGDLVSDAGGLTRLEFPYEPPEEYDFEIAFTRLEGRDCVVQFCAAGGRQFRWIIDGFHENKSGFDLIRGMAATENPTSRVIKLTNGRRYVSIVKVRKNRVEAWLDGKMVDEWKTDYQDFALPVAVRLPHSMTLGLGSSDSPTLFHSAKVTEVTGAGKHN